MNNGFLKSVSDECDWSKRTHLCGCGNFLFPPKQLFILCGGFKWIKQIGDSNILKPTPTIFRQPYNRAYVFVKDLDELKLNRNGKSPIRSNSSSFSL